MAEAELPKVGFADTLRILALAGGPQLAKGVILRRPAVVGLLARTGAEAAGVRLLAAMRRKYGRGPLLFRAGKRRLAIVLDAQDAVRVLEASPLPFDPATPEKRSALAHFEPRGSLVSSPADRLARRAFSDRVLESGCPVHSLAAAFAEAVEEETAELGSSGTLAWTDFRSTWFRLVRRIVFGASAAGDAHLTDQLDRLRGDSNWAFLKPKRRHLREAVLAAIQARLRRADPGSLGALVGPCDYAEAAAPDQVAQWLFAFDAAGIATFRALALLGTGARVSDMPFLRAAIEETVRLWPTTPLILRETRQEFEFSAGRMPSGTGVIIHLPFLHRDPDRHPFADRFEPDIWLDGRAAEAHLLPFSGGPGLCPGRDLVLLLGSLVLASLLRRAEFRSYRPLDPDALPATFDHFSLTLHASPRGAEPRRGAPVHAGTASSKG
jgi:cytochrome P450